MIDAIHLLLLLGVIVPFGMAVSLLFPLVHHKRPEVPWSRIHPGADNPIFIGRRALILWMPEYLTDEGRWRHRMGLRWSAAAAVAWIASAVIGLLLPAG